MNRRPFPCKQRGMALILAMLALLIVTFVSVANLRESEPGLGLAPDFAKHSEAHEIAVVGLKKGIDLLNNYIEEHADFDRVLFAASLNDGTLLEQGDSGEPLRDVPFSSGQYSLTALNDLVDLHHSGKPLDDTNQAINLRVQGTQRDGARATLDVLLQSASYGLAPLPRAAVSLCGPADWLRTEPATKIPSGDWALPHSNACTGESCPVNATAGKPASIAALSGQPLGKATVVGMQTGPLPCDNWKAASSAIAQLSSTLPHVDFLTHSSLQATLRFGSREHPSVLIINPGIVPLRLSGDLKTFGVAVVAGEVVLEPQAKWQHEGLILFVGEEAAIDQLGAMTVWGALLLPNAPRAGKTPLQLSSRGNINFSSAGLALAQEALSPASLGLLPIAWRESYD